MKTRASLRQSTFTANWAGFERMRRLRYGLRVPAKARLRHRSKVYARRVQFNPRAGIRLRGKDAHLRAHMRKGGV